MMFRGKVLRPNHNGFDYLDDAIIEIHDGIILSIHKAPSNCEIPETHPNAVWLPGLVDGHLHYPQTNITGSASGPLLPWLNQSVFPEESKFQSKDYAKKVAELFCERLINAGTTTAFIYSSAHPQATDILFETLEKIEFEK